MDNEQQNPIPQSEQLQIVKVATPEHSGLVEEFHVVITNASVPGMTVSASCHAHNIAAEEAHEVLWQLSRLIQVKA